MISWLYKTLSNPELRLIYEKNWLAFQRADIDTESEVALDGYIAAGKTRPFSYGLKNKYQELLEKYQQTPKKKFPSSSKRITGIPELSDILGLDEHKEDHQKTESMFYTLESTGEKYRDIFTFIQAIYTV